LSKEYPEVVYALNREIKRTLTTKHLAKANETFKNLAARSYALDDNKKAPGVAF
jgi:hypothetical protein